ncbi:MAG TPA: galactose-1-epimerase, partial [Spirochaetota bacterium]|nr:galactose-1-epimerase [Spirochaetota bacterium]
MEIRKNLFGKTKDGSDIHLFTLKNQDMTVTLTNFGGIVTSILVPDRKGKVDDVVLGFNNLDSYLKGHPFFGALVGRYGNRIGNSKFTLEGKEYKLVANDGKNHLHGGTVGFDKVVWKAAEVRESGRVGIRLQYLSVDGEEGYPGNLNVTVYYFL